MRRPLVPALAVLLSTCLLAASGSADPAKTKTPRELLKDKVCKEGAYVRRKPKPKKEAKPDDKTEKGSDTAPSLPVGDGGEFSPPGDDGISKFTPNGDCAASDKTGFDKLFDADAGGVSLADSLEIAPAAKDGKPVLPGSESFASLSGLTSLLKDPARSATVMNGFFDGDPDSLKDIRANANAAAAADAAVDGAVVAGDFGPKVLPPMTASPKPDLDGRPVPSPNAPIETKVVIPPPPKVHYDPKAADNPPAAPMARPFFGGLANDYRAVRDDYGAGSPIRLNEGILADRPHDQGAVHVDTNFDPSITVPLPGAIVDPRVEAGKRQLAPPAAGINPAGCKPGCYGTQMMINLLTSMGDQYSNYIGGKLNVGGISLFHGGPFPPHVSHAKGIDADVTFAGGRTFDIIENAMIVASVVKALPNFKHVNGREYILVDQSKHAYIRQGLAILQQKGIITQEQAQRGGSVLVHWPLHNDHFHVRICPDCR